MADRNDPHYEERLRSEDGLPEEDGRPLPAGDEERDLPEDEDESHEPGDQSGEDEGGSAHEGSEDHLKEDQKPIGR